MRGVTPSPGGPRPTGQPSEWFKWAVSNAVPVQTGHAYLINEYCATEAGSTPEIGDHREASQPSEWFKMVTGKSFRKRPAGLRIEGRRKKATADKLLELRARVAASKRESRKLADAVKPHLADDHDCPYCGSVLGDEKHADHIHPLAKGGLSVVRNMVWVCAECNLRKGEMTLTAFVKKFHLNRDAIESRLEALGKDF